MERHAKKREWNRALWDLAVGLHALQDKYAHGKAPWGRHDTWYDDPTVQPARWSKAWDATYEALLEFRRSVRW